MKTSKTEEGSALPLVIRAMDAKDLECCTALYLDTFSREPWNDSDPPEAVRRYIQNMLESPAGLCYVAEQDGELVGLCLGMSKPWIQGIEYYVDQFCVAPAWQRQGIGKCLLNGAAKLAAQKGGFGMLLHTERTFPAFDFYRKNGFQELEGLTALGRTGD